MFRTTTTRPLFKGLVKFSSARSSYSIASKRAAVAPQLRSLGSKRPHLVAGTAFKPINTSILRFATNYGPLYDKADSKGVAGQQIQAHPGSVSLDSSVRHVLESSEQEEHDPDMLKGIRGDMETIKDTFALNDVPRDTYYLGAAGLIPYVATSFSTVFLAWDINYAHNTGQGLYISADAAHQLLEILEPIQIGYGAVIISFLGAIHWGLEFGGYGGHQGYSRYAIGVVAPAVAWPTMLMPVEYALITQFLAFNFLYFADTRATKKGWCPPWYGTYRFVLTFVVGACIVASLVGRGQIVASEHRSHMPVEVAEQMDEHWERLEKEERERRHAAAAAEAEGGEDGDQAEEGDEE